jgi:hypothetical protein
MIYSIDKILATTMKHNGRYGPAKSGWDIPHDTRDIPHDFKDLTLGARDIPHYPADIPLGLRGICFHLLKNK